MISENAQKFKASKPQFFNKTDVLEFLLKGVISQLEQMKMVAVLKELADKYSEPQTQKEIEFLYPEYDLQRKNLEDVAADLRQQIQEAKLFAAKGIAA